MNDASKKNEGKKLLEGLMKRLIRYSSANVPQPLPVIEEKAENRLSTDGLISWKIILKEWEKVSAKDKKVISSLLTLNSFDIMETFDMTSNLLEEQKDTAYFIQNHPEYGKSEEDINTAIAADDFSDILKD